MTNYITDTFTGSNGSAWNSSNWTVTSGGTTQIDNNKGQMAPSSGAAIVIEAVPTIPADFTFTGQVTTTFNNAQAVITYRFNAARTIGYRLIILGDTILLYSDNAGSGSTLIGYAGGLARAYDAHRVSFGSGAGTPTPTVGQRVQYDDDSGAQSGGVVEAFTGSSTSGSVTFVCYDSNGLPSVTTALGNGVSISKVPSVTWTASMTSLIASWNVINFRLEVSGTTHKFRYWRKYDNTGALATEPTTWTFNLTDTVSTTQAAKIEIKYSSPNLDPAYLDNVSIDSVAASGPTGTAAITLAGATSSGTGTTTPTGTSARTLTGATSTGTGTSTSTTTGTAAITLAGATSTGTGTTTPTGTSASALGNATSAASGSTGSNPTGLATNTLTGATSSASGTATNGGTATNTLTGATSSGTGTTTPTGTSARTLTGATSTGTGNTTLTGTSARTLTGATSTGTGSITYTGAASQLLGSLISGGSGSVAVNYSVQAKVAIELRSVGVQIELRSVLVAIAAYPS